MDCVACPKGPRLGIAGALPKSPSSTTQGPNSHPRSQQLPKQPPTSRGAWLSHTGRDTHTPTQGHNTPFLCSAADAAPCPRAPTPHHKRSVSTSARVCISVLIICRLSCARGHQLYLGPTRCHRCQRQAHCQTRPTPLLVLTPPVSTHSTCQLTGAAQPPTQHPQTNTCMYLTETLCLPV